MTQWVNPERAEIVNLVERFRSPVPRPSNACGCTKRIGLAATIIVDGDGTTFTVGCNGCGGMGLLPPKPE